MGYVNSYCFKINTPRHIVNYLDLNNNLLKKVGVRAFVLL